MKKPGYARTLGSYVIDQVSIENDKAQRKEVVPLTDITDEEETQKEIEQNYSKIKGKSMEDAQAMREIFFNQSNP